MPKRGRKKKTQQVSCCWQFVDAFAAFFNRDRDRVHSVKELETPARQSPPSEDVDTRSFADQDFTAERRAQLSPKVLSRGFPTCPDQLPFETPQLPLETPLLRLETPREAVARRKREIADREMARIAQVTASLVAGQPVRPRPWLSSDGVQQVLVVSGSTSALDDCGSPQSRSSNVASESPPSANVIPSSPSLGVRDTLLPSPTSCTFSNATENQDHQVMFELGLHDNNGTSQEAAHRRKLEAADGDLLCLKAQQFEASGFTIQKNVHELADREMVSIAQASNVSEQPIGPHPALSNDNRLQQVLIANDSIPRAIDLGGGDSPQSRSSNVPSESPPSANVIPSFPSSGVRDTLLPSPSSCTLPNATRNSEHQVTFALCLHDNEETPREAALRRKLEAADRDLVRLKAQQFEASGSASQNPVQVRHLEDQVTLAWGYDNNETPREAARRRKLEAVNRDLARLKAQQSETSGSAIQKVLHVQNPVNEETPREAARRRKFEAADRDLVRLKAQLSEASASAMQKPVQVPYSEEQVMLARCLRDDDETPREAAHRRKLEAVDRDLARLKAQQSEASGFTIQKAVQVRQPVNEETPREAALRRKLEAADGDLVRLKAQLSEASGSAFRRVRSPQSPPFATFDNMENLRPTIELNLGHADDSEAGRLPLAELPSQSLMTPLSQYEFMEEFKPETQRKDQVNDSAKKVFVVD